MAVIAYKLLYDCYHAFGSDQKYAVPKSEVSGITKKSKASYIYPQC